MTNQDRFDTGTAFTQATDTQQILNSMFPMLQQMLGPAIAGPIQQFLGPTLQSFMSGSLSLPGMNMQGAPSTWLSGGNINPGISAYHAINNSAIGANLGSVSGAINEALREQNKQFHMWMGDDAKQATISSSGFNVTNFLSAMQFKSHKPEEFYRAMEETQRYMGAGSSFGMSPDMAEYQASVNQRAKGVTTAVTRDFFRNMDQYSGLGGEEVGQLTAELARTGAFSGGDDADFTNATRKVKDMAKTVKQLRMFFKGGVADLIDQVNGLSGTDFQATFGPAGAEMLARSQGIGFATGHTNQQMMALASMSGNVARSLGGDTFGAIANSQDIATALGAIRNTSGSRAFTNEQRIRAGVVTGVTRAQQSNLARDISGAYALLKGQGKSEDEIASFMSGLQGQGASLNASAIADAITDQFGIDANAGQLRNFAGGDVAMGYRHSGKATGLAMSADLDLVQRQRRQMLTHMLQQRGRGDLMKNLVGKDITGATIREALGGGAFADEMVGAFRSLDDANSLAMTNMSSRDLDLHIKGQANQKELDRISAQAGVRVDLGRMSEGIGTLSGLRNLSTLATDKPGSFKEFMDIALGRSGVDLSDKKYAKLLPNLQKVLATTSREGQTGKQAMMSQIGMSRAMKALVSGSPEEARKAAELFGDTNLTPEQLEERVREFAEGDKAAMRELNIGEKVSEYLKTDHYGEKDMDKARKRAEMVVTGEELASKDKYYTITDKDKKESFKKTLEARTEALRSVEAGGVAKDLKEFWKSKGGKEGLMGEEEFKTALEKESSISSAMSGAPQERIAASMQAILDLLMNNLPNK